MSEAIARLQREAELLMDQLEGIERDNDTSLARIQERAARLQFLDLDVDLLVALSRASRRSFPPIALRRIGPSG